MKNIRIQNDIIIKWRIYRYGEPEQLDGKPIVVKLFDPQGKSAPITYSFSGNEVTVTFEGRNQSRLGAYTLFLSENAGQTGMTTIDKTEAFTLVAHSNMEGGSCCNPMVSVETVDLSSDIDVPACDCPFDIDDNGILVVKATGKRYKLTPYVPEPIIERTDYSIPDVSLSYPDISAQGGSVMPTLSYSQVKTDFYSDGTTTKETITSGAEVTYEGADTDGKVTAQASTSASKEVVATVTVKVTLNGKEATKEVKVYQAAKPVTVIPKVFYAGHITASKSAFTALSTDELKAKATEMSITANATKAFTAKENCFFLLIGNDLTFDSCYFVSGGLTTNLTPSDFDLVHDDVTIDGKTFKVYGYRFNGVSESNPLTYNYKLIVKK